MERIAIVTNSKTPYRKLQFENFKRNTDYSINVYYTDKNVMGRKWNVDVMNDINEYRLSYLNSNEYKSLISVVKENDYIFIGGYEKIKYLVLALLCKIYKKKYVLIFDGIDPLKVEKFEGYFKFNIKKIFIKNAYMIFGNGKISKKFFVEKFNYNEKKIINQFLSVDNQTIFELKKNKKNLKHIYRKQLGISLNSKVIIYSGRLVARKNVHHILSAINNLENKENYTLLILGDGEEKEKLIIEAKKKCIDIVVTGFIKNQKELFNHYFAGDLLILPSSDEPWGLVVNEAMAAGLPVIVSTNCGCSYDLIDENGYIFSTGNIEDLKKSIEILEINNSYEEFGLKSIEIIKKWDFENSCKSFKEIMYELKK